MTILGVLGPENRRFWAMWGLFSMIFGPKPGCRARPSGLCHTVYAGLRPLYTRNRCFQAAKAIVHNFFSLPFSQRFPEAFLMYCKMYETRRSVLAKTPRHCAPPRSAHEGPQKARGPSEIIYNFRSGPGPGGPGPEDPYQSGQLGREVGINGYDPYQYGQLGPSGWA